MEFFMSGSFDEIKIWSLKYSFKFINTIKVYEDEDFYLNEENLSDISLYLLGRDLMVSRYRLHDNQFKIWDLKTYKCLQTFEEKSFINILIITKNNDIFTETSDNKINLWKILF